MKQTINRISNRVGDWSTTLFAITAWLLVPHAIIRPIIGYGLHHWIPIQWLALHAVLIILVLCAALAGCSNASKTSTPTYAIAAGNHGVSGISCDWDHVSGADKEPR